MADAFAPKVQSSIAVEQPVQMPSILGGLANLGASIAKSSASKNGPSATQVKSAALQPFASRLEDLHGSNLEQGEFVKTARKMARTQMSATPEYQNDVMGILSNYGITPEVTVTTEADVFNSGLNAWLKTPEGVNAVVRGKQFTADGTLDPEATSANVRSSFFDYLSEQTAIEESNRELKLAENDVNTHKALSDSKLQEFIPKWMEQSQATVDGIIAGAVAGEAKFDSPEEQLLALRQERADALSMYRGKAAAAGIHSDIYSEKIKEVVKPFDDLIKLAEDVRVDNQLFFTAYENAKKMGMDKLLIKNFGAWGPHPAFAEEVMRQMANTAIASNENAMKSFLLGSEEFSTEGFMDGLQFIPGVPASTKSAVDTPSTAVLNPEVLKTYRDGAAADDSYLSRKVETSIQLLNGVEDAGKEQESIFRSLGSIYAASVVDDRPLGMAYLQQIFNPSAIRNITTASGTGGIGVDIKNTVASFSADQIRRQVGVISALTRSNPHLSVVQQDGTLTVMRDGRPLPEAIKETGTVKDLFEAVNAVNFINQSVSRLEGVAEETVPLTGNLMGIQPDANIDELREFLDQPVTGGDGTDDLEGGTGTDVLYSDTITRADGTIEKVTKDTVISKEDAEKTLPVTDVEHTSGTIPQGGIDTNVGAQGLLSLIDRKEGGGDYDTLFGHSQREGGRFAGTKVSQMTIGELKQFARGGEYGSWVKAKNPKGKFATPMGRYQFVGDTLFELTDRLGIPDTAVFDSNLQDFLFSVKANDRLSGKTSQAAKRQAMRNEWDGFNSVSDAELDAAIASFESGEPMQFGGYSVRGGSAAPKTSPRPEPTGVSTPQVAQGGAVATSPRPQARPEGGTTREAPKGSQRASEVATEQQLQRLINANLDVDNVFNFNSEEDLNNAIQSGQLKEGDVVMIDGQVFVLE